MTIVCGTDLSGNAQRASRAATAIAKRLRVPLKLVYVIDELGAELTVESKQDAIYDPLRQTLRERAAELRAEFGIEVEPIAVAGLAYEKLIEIASASHARLIVVSSLGEKKQHRWLLGSVAERVAQSSPLPVLVIRDGARIEAWARGDKPLRVMVGVELASTSRAALRWATEMRTIGRADLLITQIASPSGEHLRLGVPPPMPLDHLVPELHETLMRDLQTWAGEVAGEGETTFRVIPGAGRADVHLTQLADEAEADLLVVGTHQRAGVSHLWQGSVSRGVLHHAHCNVACVPRRDSAEDERGIPTFRRVLIPTDFSSLANRAIASGYGLLSSGGVAHLLHVVTGKSGEDERDSKRRLHALIPLGAAARGIVTEIEVMNDQDAGMGIWHAAGRLGVDAICMATHGRSGPSQLLLGSQAQEVVRRARQPVFLVPPERDGR